MKKVIPWSIVLVLSVGGGLYSQSCFNTMHARAELRIEVEKYYDSASMRAGAFAFRLARPYLDAENKGVYGQRLNYLDRHGVTFLSDTYSSLMWDLATSELKHWAALKLDSTGQMHEENALRETPYEQIMDLHKASQDIGLVSYKLISDEHEPKSMEEVVQMRVEFAEAKRKMEELLVRANSG